MSNPIDISAKMKHLEALACPTKGDRQFFDELMSVANEHRMNYLESLRFTIRMQHGGYN